MALARMLSGVFFTSHLLERLVNSRARGGDLGEGGRDARGGLVDVDPVVQVVVHELGVVPKGHPVIEILDPLVVQLDARGEKGQHDRNTAGDDANGFVVPRYNIREPVDETLHT